MPLLREMVARVFAHLQPSLALVKKGGTISCACPWIQLFLPEDPNDND